VGVLVEVGGEVAVGEEEAVLELEDVAALCGGEASAPPWRDAVDSGSENAEPVCELRFALGGASALSLGVREARLL
jgi:hypothetical protein